MGESLHATVIDLAEQAGDAGVSMGALVDTLDNRGHAVEHVEQAIWQLLAQRRLTPCGFICRLVRRRGDPHGEDPVRSYELMLAPWSPHLDAQLELELSGH